VTQEIKPQERLQGDALDRARRRSTRLLMAAVALSSIANIAAFTVAVIAARELLDDASLAGMPNTTAIIGTAVGTSLLAALMVRRGRRFGLVLGLAIAAVGAVIAAWSVLEGSFAWLLVGSLLFGAGNASSQLSRYVAADMAPAVRRGWVIGLVVWAGTVGAIVGPNLISPAATIGERLGLAELAGPFLLAAGLMAAAALLLLAWLRPDPYELADESSRIDPADAAGGESMRRIVRRPRVTVAIVAMVVGQVVMVGIMTMTPVHMDEHGHGLEAVGLVISAHTLGMFLLSPLSGRIVERFGPVPSILTAAAVLALSAFLAMVAPVDAGPLLLVGLFLLGYGWNLGFVAGSTLLVSGVEHAERTRAEGFSDSLVWGSSAVASLASGFILAGLGYAALGAVGLVLVGLGTLVVLRLRGSVGPAPALD
jgi:MFS family permease